MTVQFTTNSAILKSGQIAFNNTTQGGKCMHIGMSAGFSGWYFKCLELTTGFACQHANTSKV